MKLPLKASISVAANPRNCLLRIVAPEGDVGEEIASYRFSGRRVHSIFSLDIVSF